MGGIEREVFDFFMKYKTSGTLDILEFSKSVILDYPDKYIYPQKKSTDIKIPRV